MLLKSIEDNRSNLQRATRWELYQFAQANGVKEIVHDMPATVMRQILINKRITNIKIPNRPLGAQSQPPAVQQTRPASPDQKVVEVDADADLVRQWTQQKAAPEPEPEPPVKHARPPKYPKRLKARPPQEINQLRDECKRLKIKMDRRDTKKRLKEKIAAAKAGNGQNTVAIN
jgi:hypothetical protein